NSYVTGFVLEEQADRRRHADTGETPPEDMPAEQQERLLQGTPALGEAIRQGGDPGGEAAFEDGLRTIIAGIGDEKRGLDPAASGLGGAVEGRQRPARKDWFPAGKSRWTAVTTAAWR